MGDQGWVGQEGRVVPARRPGPRLEAPPQRRVEPPEGEGERGVVGWGRATVNHWGNPSQDPTLMAYAYFASRGRFFPKAENF